MYVFLIFLIGGRADRQHIVTLWLIGWSYSFNLTYIGNAVFVSMDVSDIFLAVRLPRFGMSRGKLI
jgi:hypothetical protein